MNGRIVGKGARLKVRLTPTARVEGDIIHKTIRHSSPSAHFRGVGPAPGRPAEPGGEGMPARATSTATNIGTVGPLPRRGGRPFRPERDAEEYITGIASAGPVPVFRCPDGPAFFRPARPFQTGPAFSDRPAFQTGSVYERAAVEVPGRVDRSTGRTTKSPRRAAASPRSGSTAMISPQISMTERFPRDGCAGLRRSRRTKVDLAGRGEAAGETTRDRKGEKGHRPADDHSGSPNAPRPSGGSEKPFSATPARTSDTRADEGGEGALWAKNVPCKRKIITSHPPPSRAPGAAARRGSTPKISTRQAVRPGLEPRARSRIRKPTAPRKVARAGKPSDSCECQVSVPAPTKAEGRCPRTT